MGLLKADKIKFFVFYCVLGLFETSDHPNPNVEVHSVVADVYMASLAFESKSKLSAFLTVFLKVTSHNNT